MSWSPIPSGRLFLPLAWQAGPATQGLHLKLLDKTRSQRWRQWHGKSCYLEGRAGGRQRPSDPEYPHLTQHSCFALGHLAAHFRTSHIQHSLGSTMDGVIAPDLSFGSHQESCTIHAYTHANTHSRIHIATHMCTHTSVSAHSVHSNTHVHIHVLSEASQIRGSDVVYCTLGRENKSRGARNSTNPFACHCRVRGDL